MDALIHRLNAIGDTRAILHALQLSVIHEAQALVPRKTGHLFRTIVPGALTATYARVVVNAPYGLFVEKGTGLFGPKHHRIVPTTKKALRWTGGGPARVRLSGRSRVVKGKSLGDAIFATSTAGMKAQPFFERGVANAARKSGLGDVVVAIWNEAD
jgi:hypothetical protein